MKVNRNVNKYIKDCKHFFPFLSKNEKKFLKRLKTNIIENIRYGKPDATDAEIINAAKLANAHDFIMKQADKYQTMIIGNGHNLSGGEKQRIAMARAIIKNSPIIILDEATSALDNESEFLIQDTITKLKKTKTIITIAHKQATIDFADIVIEL